MFKIYYDNGQIEISGILASVFTVLLPEVEIKKVTPSDYRLFQTADMFCSMELIRLKMDAAALSPSELEFFGNVRDVLIEQEKIQNSLRSTLRWKLSRVSLGNYLNIKQRGKTT